MPRNRLLIQVVICTTLAACVSQPRNAGTAVVQGAPPVRIISSAIVQQLGSARRDLESGNYPQGLAEARAVESAPNLTAYDVHMINELLAYGFSHDGELVLAADYLERGLADGLLRDDERALRINTLAILNYQIRNYAKAVRFGTLSVNEETADEKTFVVVSQSYYLQGDYRAAATFTSEHADAVIARHEVPSESALQVILSSCAKLDDRSCEAYSLENLVKYHSKPQYEKQLDALLRGKH